jgi:hypothetical protein
MSKQWKPSVKLIAVGMIVSHLHYGPFLRNWWHIKTSQNNGTKIEQFYPFRIGMKTQVMLKNRPFIVRVVQGNEHNNLLPGFLCESLLESNEKAENNPTSAISKLYKKIFKNETRFSGILMMGMEDTDILNELVSDLSFQPFLINIPKIKILIHSIGTPTKQGARPGFASSLIHYKSAVLFFQTINEDGCSICIYKENKLSEVFHGSNPIDVWKKLEILEEWSGETLFGLNNSDVMEKIEHAKLTCFHDEWHNYSKMEQIFRYHLQRRTSSQIDWYSLFQEWKKSNCPIIELHNRLSLLYPDDYIFSERELRAWRALLCAAGCVDITPFSKEESEVIIFFLCHIVRMAPQLPKCNSAINMQFRLIAELRYIVEIRSDLRLLPERDFSGCFFQAGKFYLFIFFLSFFFNETLTNVSSVSFCKFPPASISALDFLDW